MGVTDFTTARLIRGATLQLRPKLADAVARFVSPADLTVHEIARSTGTFRETNALRTLPARKTLGWP